MNDEEDERPSLTNPKQKSEKGACFNGRGRAEGVVRPIEGKRGRIGLREWEYRVQQSGEVIGEGGFLAGTPKGSQGEEPSQQLSHNEMRESCHPMILSQINNPKYNCLAILRIRNAASELRQAQLDLADFVDEQTHLQQAFLDELGEQLKALVGRAGAQGARSGGRALEEAEARVQQLTTENEALQEHIFDMEQRMVGVELEVARRLKERGRQAERLAANAAREESRDIIAQLQAEINALRQKCAALQSSVHPSQLREKEYQLSETQQALAKRQETLRQEFAQLQTRKEASYQREHELLASEEALTRKISDLRKKEAQLSEWQAELTRKSRAVRAVREVVGTHSHLQEASREELDRSGQASLRSFGARHKEEDLKIATTSLEVLGIRHKHMANNEEEAQSPRQPTTFVRERYERPKQNGESGYQVRQGVEQGRRVNTHTIRQDSQISQVSSHHASREASPYRILGDLKARSINPSAQYLPRTSPRSTSKNSRISVSRGRSGGSGGGGQGGLGSKLQRLREQIKKQIESIQ